MTQSCCWSRSPSQVLPPAPPRRQGRPWMYPCPCKGLIQSGKLPSQMQDKVIAPMHTLLSSVSWPLHCHPPASPSQGPFTLHCPSPPRGVAVPWLPSPEGPSRSPASPSQGPSLSPASPSPGLCFLPCFPLSRGLVPSCLAALVHSST